MNLLKGLAVVEGEVSHTSLSESEDATVSTESAKTLLPQIPLPEAADIDAATAEFRGKELRITIPLKLEQQKQQKELAVGRAAG